MIQNMDLLLQMIINFWKIDFEINKLVCHGLLFEKKKILEAHSNFHVQK